MSFALADDGVSLFYEVNGTGNDVLVLIAGQANNHRWWEVPRPDFDGRFRTVVFDHRGTGRSDKPDDGYSTRGFAGDVRAILDDMGVERAHVYGTSMGGRVAQWFAADHPDRVRGLVLGCTSPGGTHGIERSAEVRRSLAQRDGAAARQALLELMYTPDWLTTHHGPFTTIGDPAMPPHARRGHFTASKEHDGWDALAKITAPTLVIHGADDIFNPAANAPLIAARIPNARLHMVPRARHAYFEEFRDAASPPVLAHLGS